MENSKLLVISLLISLFGIFTLLIISTQLQPKEITTNSSIKLNDYVKISGKIVLENRDQDFSVITLQDDYGKLQITCNCPRSWLNRTVEISGKITEYRNKFQINAEKINQKEIALPLW